MKKRLRITIIVLLIILVAQNIYLLNKRMWKLKDATQTTKAYIGGVVSEVDKLNRLLENKSDNKLILKSVQNIKMNLHDVRNVLAHTKDFVDNKIFTADDYFRANEKIMEDIIKDYEVDNKELIYINVLKEEMISVRNSINNQGDKKDFLTVEEFKKVFQEIGDYSVSEKNEQDNIWNKYKDITK